MAHSNTQVDRFFHIGFVLLIFLFLVFHFGFLVLATLAMLVLVLVFGHMSNLHLESNCFLELRLLSTFVVTQVFF